MTCTVCGFRSDSSKAWQYPGKKNWLEPSRGCLTAIMYCPVCGEMIIAQFVFNERRN